MKHLFFLVLLLCTASCNSQGPGLDQTDYRHITDALERWEAYALDDYTIDQEVICFCPPPRAFTLQIVADTLHDVAYDKAELVGWQLSEEEFKRIVLGGAFTVEEVFETITRAQGQAALLEVEYDPIYGYPSYVAIDWATTVADDEVTIRMSNLRF